MTTRHDGNGERWIPDGIDRLELAARFAARPKTREAAARGAPALIEEILVEVHSRARYDGRGGAELLLALLGTLRDALRHAPPEQRGELLRALRREEPLAADPLLRALLRAALGRRPDPEEREEGGELETISFATLRHDPLPFPGWLLEGLLPAEGVSILTGPGGVGKTLTALRIAASVLCGRPFGPHNASRKGGVAIVELEGGLALLQGRLEALDLDEPQAELLQLIRGPERADPTIGPRDAVRLIEEARARDDRLLVIDPLRRLHCRDENDASRMAEVLAPISRAAVGIGVLLIHHDRKGGGYRGSSVILDEATTLLGLSDTGAGLVLEVIKQRIGAPPPPLRLRIEADGARARAEVDPGALGGWAPAAAPSTRTLLLDALGDGTWCTAEKLAQTIGRSPRRVRERLATMPEIRRRGGQPRHPAEFSLAPNDPGVSGDSGEPLGNRRNRQKLCPPPEDAAWTDCTPPLEAPERPAPPDQTRTDPELPGWVTEGTEGDTP